MSKSLNISFPPKDEPLLKRVVASCPKSVTIAEHGRNLWREALDATCHAAPTKNRRKKV